jgi:FkbM family methyltransferase
MLITPKTLKRVWGIDPKVLLHIGAHEAEELKDYLAMGWGSEKTVWVEALPEKAELVRGLVADLPNQSVINIVVWDKSGDKIKFNETNNGESSSALPLKDHSSLYPKITVSRVREFTTTTIADALDLDAMGTIGLLNLDIQGAELRALKGFGKHIAQVSAVYSEVNVREIYEGCAQLPDLDEWLGAQGFTRVDWTVLKSVGWGDALWIRNELLPPDIARRRFFRKARDSWKNVRSLAGVGVRRLSR